MLIYDLVTKTIVKLFYNFVKCLKCDLSLGHFSDKQD